MKKRMRKAGILLVVFVAAIFVSSLFMNNGVDDQIIDLGDPTLPRISFQKEGRTVNALAGYVNEMDVTAMRDTITPLEANGTLQIQIEEFMITFFREKLEVQADAECFETTLLPERQEEKYPTFS